MTTTVNFHNTLIAFQHKSQADLFRAYGLFSIMNYPSLLKTGIWCLNQAHKWHMPMLNPILRHTIFPQFCGGETLEQAHQCGEILVKAGVGVILDYAAEGSAAKDSHSLQKTFSEVQRTIQAAQHRNLPFAVFKLSGLFTYETLSNPQKTDRKAILALCTQLATQAHVCGVHLMIDAEETWLQETIDFVAENLMAQFNRNTPIIFHTLQMYRKDRLAYLHKLIQQAKTQGFQLGIKLVRGAYLEKERHYAQTHKQPSPLYDTKAHTDQAYDEALDICLDHSQWIYLIAGTHNEASTQHVVQRLETHTDPSLTCRVAFSQLYGMSDHLTFNLAQNGFQTLKYMPYGPVLEAIPYLIRRAQENTSIQGQASRQLYLIQQEIKRRKEPHRL